MRTARNHIPGILVLLVVVAAAGRTAPVQACPSCKVALQSPDEAGGAAGGGSAGKVARGFYWSILAMLSILALVSGGLIRLMIRASREVSAVPRDAEPAWEPSSPRT